jgi:hypothetical protein
MVCSGITCSLNNAEDYEDHWDLVLENAHEHSAQDCSTRNAEANWQ